MFYLNWKSQLDILSDKELRRFIDNLISWHQNEKVELKTKTDLLVWNGVLPALEVNDDKWNSRADKSRENGKLGGRPKKEITQETQQVISKPNKPDNSKMLIDNGKMERVKGKGVNVESELTIGDNQMLTGNQTKSTGESLSTYLKREIDTCNQILDSEFSNLPFLKSMANPHGINELFHHLDNEEEIERIKPVLERLAELKFKLRGNYE